MAAWAYCSPGLVNSPVKGLLALVIGGRRLGLRVMLPYLLSILLILPLVWLRQDDPITSLGDRTAPVPLSRILPSCSTGR